MDMAGRQGYPRLMLDVLAATLPIFTIIAIGFLVVRGGLLPADATRGLGVFVLNIALPALIFKSLSQRAFLDVLNPTVLLAYGLGTAITAAAVFATARYMLKRETTAAAIMALGSAGPNTGFVGYPIAALVVGPTAVIALALAMLIENLLTIPLLLAVAESGQGSGKTPGQIIASSLRALVKNPMIIAILLGTLASVTGLHLPAPLEKSVDMLAAASAPVALVFIGIALAGLKVSRRLEGLALVVLGKLILHPAAVAAILLLLPPLAPDLRKALLILVSSPMMTIYPLLGQRFGHGEMTAAAIMVATILAFVTMSGIIQLL